MKMPFLIFIMIYTIGMTQIQKADCREHDLYEYNRTRKEEQREELLKHYRECAAKYQKDLDEDDISQEEDEDEL